MALFGKKESHPAVEYEDAEIPKTSSFGDDRSGASREERGLEPVIRTVIFVFLGVLAVGVSLFFTGLSVQGVVFDRTMFFVFLSLFAFVAWVVGGVYSGRLELRRTPLDIPLLLFWATYAIAMFLSVDMWHSFVGGFIDPSRGFIVVSASILLYYVVVSTQSRVSLERLVGLFVFGMGVFALWSAFAISGAVRGLPYIGSILGALPANDLFSLNILLSVTLPLMVAYILYAVPTIQSVALRWVGAFAGIIVVASIIYVLASLFLSPTLIMLFIGLGIFISYVSGNIIKVSRQWYWLPLALFLLVLPMLYIFGQEVFAKEGLELNQRVLPGISISWEVFVNTLSEKFLTGTGPATYGYAFSRYFPESLNETDAFAQRLSYPSNFLLEMGVTTGILGAVTFVMFLAFALSVGVFLLTQRRDTNSVLSLGLWVSLLVLGMAGFFYGLSGTVLLPAVVIGVFAVSLLMYESGARAETVVFSLRSAPQYALASTLLLLVSCIGALALFATLGKMYVADMYAGNAFRKQFSDPTGAVQEIEKAIRLNGKEGQYFVFRGRMYLAIAEQQATEIDAQQENSENDREQARQIQLLVAEGVRSITRGRDLLPGNIFAQEVLAQTVESLQALDDAYTLYEEASRIEPKNPMYPVKMAQIKIAQAQRAEDPESLYGQADRLLADAMALKENYSEVWYQKALISEGREDMNGAIDNATRALEYGQDMRTALLLARLYQTRNGEGDAKTAENILTSILSVNDKEINALLGLAGLYEKSGRTDEAVNTYTKARDLLPAGAQNARQQLDEVINRVKNGGTGQPIQNPDAPQISPIEGENANSSDSQTSVDNTQQ